MTKDEALKLVQDALVALENISTALREDDVIGDDIEMLLSAITYIRIALAQPDEDAIIIQYHKATIKRLENRIEELTAQPEERYFCQRCGKPVNLTTIHTCTPPQIDPNKWAFDNGLEST